MRLNGRSGLSDNLMILYFQERQDSVYSLTALSSCFEIITYTLQCPWGFHISNAQRPAGLSGTALIELAILADYVDDCSYVSLSTVAGPGNCMQSNTIAGWKSTACTADLEPGDWGHRAMTVQKGKIRYGYDMELKFSLKNVVWSKGGIVVSTDKRETTLTCKVDSKL